MDNTNKFSGKADGYSKYRPGYPQALYDFLIESFHITRDNTIVDIGAGTGKFSLPILENGIKVVCVEPNTDMKKIMDNQCCKHSNYTGVNASAENTSLPNNSVDYITVAQAFHWFERDLFQKECKRILKPKGKVFLVWNVRNEEDAVTKDLFELNKKFCKDFRGFTGGMSKIDCGQFSDFYKQGNCQVRIFENNIVYDTVDSFIGRCLSSSYAPKLGDECYKEYVEKLKKIYNIYQGKEGVIVRQNTVMYYGEI